MKTRLAIKRIERYITKVHSTYTVQQLVNIYLSYWVGDWYVNYTAKDIISKHLIEFRVLTGVYTNRK